MTQIQNDSTKVQFTEVYRDFKGAVSELAEALKVGAEHVYQVLVTQQYVQSVTLLILYALLLSISFISWKVVISFVSKKAKEESKLERYERGDWLALYIIPSIVSILSTGIIIKTLNTCVTGFVNPEYGAMKDIIEFVK